MCFHLEAATCHPVTQLLKLRLVILFLAHGYRVETAIQEPMTLWGHYSVVQKLRRVFVQALEEEKLLETNTTSIDLSSALARRRKLLKNVNKSLTRSSRHI